MQRSIHHTVYMPFIALLFSVGIYTVTLCVAPLTSGVLIFNIFSTPAHADYNLDLSADTIDIRNGRLPQPYVPTTHWLISSNSYEQATEKVSPKPIEEPIDIWQEIRAGFQLKEFDHKLVLRHEKRYTRNPKHFERILERAATYLPYFLEQTRQFNLPSEIVLLPLIESAYNPRVYSSRGAAGLWQFMPATGRLYGLKQDWWYEGRRDITYSTEAAIQHLMHLNEMFDGDWPLTFAAYNAGSNGIKRAIQSNRKKDKPADFSSLRLNSETRNYYPKLIAVKNIIQNPTAYSIQLPKVEPVSPFEIVEFDFQVDLSLLAEAVETDALQLALLNPGLRRHATPPEGPYRVLVPRQKLQQTLDWKDNLQPSDAISSTVHVVQAGDTLSEIAAEFSISLASLMSINSKSSSLIRIGEVIRIPMPQTTSGDYSSTSGLSGVDVVHRVVPGDSLIRIARQYNVKTKELRNINGISPDSDLIVIGQQLRIPDNYSLSNPSTAVASEDNLQSRILHSVNEGESLWSIARKYSVRVLDIVNWNKIGRSAYIHPGQNLVIFTY